MGEEIDADVEGWGGGRWISGCLGCRAFADSSLERLYRTYRRKQKVDGLASFLVLACLMNFVTIWTRPSVLLATVPTVAFVVAAATLVQLCKFKKFPTVSGCLGWLGCLMNAVCAPPVICPMAYIYMIFVSVALRLRYCVLLSVGVAVVYEVALLQWSSHPEETDVKYIISNTILMLIAGLLGMLGYFLDDRKQRQAFLETRQSLEVKLVIEEQSAEQERLLLSVLPEHVAVRMRQDLGSTDTQFKKIYMSRHENVSILYADIVGFTAISSTYSAQDLVAILNELFARFDRLAEKYQQLRIKILGDCYYCISGAPVERKDHASLCVRMGLAMVKSIKYLQQTTNSPVDMRVGIHTGAILAGVLGQRQWQFDVYSRDVELANKMESSGMAGRVHISEKTMSFLDGEFEVEPAYGEKREEALRLAGIKTYFIVKVLKPYQPDLVAAAEAAAANDKTAENVDSGEVLTDAPSDTKDEGDSVKSPVEEEKDGLGDKKDENSNTFNKRLRKELVKRDGKKLLMENTKMFLRFIKPEMEAAYRCRGGLRVSVAAPLTAAVLLPLLVLLASISVVPQSNLAVPLAAVATALMVFIATPFLANPKTELVIVSALSRKVNGSPDCRLIATMTAVVLLVLHNSAQMILCARAAETGGRCSWAVGCAIVGCAGGLLTAALVTLAPLSWIARGLLVVIASTPPPILAFFRLGHLTECWDISPDVESPIPIVHYLCFMMSLIIISFIYLCHHIEGTSRKLFLWKGQIEEQRERAADMRRRNEALVYNVLPPHVAAHFMGHRRRQHNELYSQSYAEVGVLFASMPNFAEFYSEETVNNQGLECLRFLNEVISDFDALLERQPFQDIIKIKTIGSSYMAAAGLNASRVVKPDDPITVRWFHLSLLVEFALELKQALQSINEQSFNHFVLKMGINHGPITAGVIGARKPHYDIWGNTVNVASRMESTGKAGCIQVTEETSNILKHFGYVFEQRGLVSVKGKGQLMTYYLLGKDDHPVENHDTSNNIKSEGFSAPHDNDKNVALPDIQPIIQTNAPVVNGVQKSPNGSIPKQKNGMLQLSPNNDNKKGDEAVKLLSQEESSTDLNIDARESDALLKN